MCDVIRHELLGSQGGNIPHNLADVEDVYIKEEKQTTRHKIYVQLYMTISIKICLETYWNKKKTAKS